MLNQLISPLVKFLEENYIKIIAAVSIAGASYIIFLISTYSLKKLKTEIFQSYPFDVFFPEGGTWSVGYFFLAILALALLAFFMFRGNFYAGPA